MAEKLLACGYVAAFVGGFLDVLVRGVDSLWMQLFLLIATR